MRDTGTMKGRARRFGAPAILAALIAVVALAAADQRQRSFAWLRPQAVPQHWGTAAVPSGARLAYPPGWRLIHSDRGTVSASPALPAGPFAGYLNVTPRQGDETLANWRRFRVSHLVEERAQLVHFEGGANRLRFRSGEGSCVMDHYSTTRARFREIACLVAGGHGLSVIVAAAPIHTWSAQAPVLERAISSFGT